MFASVWSSSEYAALLGLFLPTCWSRKRFYGEKNENKSNYDIVSSVSLMDRRPAFLIAQCLNTVYLIIGSLTLPRPPLTLLFIFYLNNKKACIWMSIPGTMKVFA